MSEEKKTHPEHNYSVTFVSKVGTIIGDVEGDQVSFLESKRLFFFIIQSLRFHHDQLKYLIEMVDEKLDIQTWLSKKHLSFFFNNFEEYGPFSTKNRKQREAEVVTSTNAVNSFV